MSGSSGPAARRFLLAAGASRAAPDDTPRRQLTLLTRGWCHLCDDMRAALAPIARDGHLDVVEVDVDADPGLDAEFGERVPVLFIGNVASGRLVCHGSLDRAKLLAALASPTEIR